MQQHDEGGLSIRESNSQGAGNEHPAQTDLRPSHVGFEQRFRSRPRPVAKHGPPDGKLRLWNRPLSSGARRTPRHSSSTNPTGSRRLGGYEKVLQAKRNGRLANLDLILPVVELRLDKFGGTVKAGDSGSGWSRINLHVIFDQVEAQFIREQFIGAISPSYRLLPGSAGEGKWQQVISRASIEALGRAILETIPEEMRGEYSSALMEGFNNLNVSADAVFKALENDALRGKCVVAVGKTEWENLKWNDHTIAEKKTLINGAHLVFTAADSPQQYDKGRAKLRECSVNDRLLDCSDAHWLSNSSDKDRIGNCFTWIKADSTFNGLVQAIEEFDDRVFVGDIPPKQTLVDGNKTKFIRSVSVAKKQGSPLAETWFDLQLPLSPDLVAIIGNKGSGKSALSDIVALAGAARNFAKFSFLTPTRFRTAKGRLASQFTATLTWHDGNTSLMDLDKDPSPSAVERVKYLPQSYLEDLCNELGDRGSSTFDADSARSSTRTFLTKTDSRSRLWTSCWRSRSRKSTKPAKP